MSQENVRLFYEELVKNKALQEKLKLEGKKYESHKADAAQTDSIYQMEVIPLAKKSGFDFTLDELKGYAEDMKKPKTGELTDQELAAVAGGQWCFCSMSGCGTSNDSLNCGSFSGSNTFCSCEINGGGTIDGDKKCGCIVFGFGNGL